VTELDARPNSASELAPVEAPMDQLKASFQKLLGALAQKGLTVALQAVDRLSEKLEDVTSRGGALTGGVGGGVKALLAGKSPVWGAVKGVIGGLSTTTKVLIVLSLVLALVLGPVLLLLLLLGLLIFAVVAAVRAAAPT
jgi:hypothetical protein